MNLYIGITNNEWYNYLKRINPEDVNFWQPGGKLRFRALAPNEPFLFKLKKPNNAIAGLGFFSSHSFLPLMMAWEVFGEGNGAKNFENFERLIFESRHSGELNPTIGCIILTNPIFFEKEDWIEVPENWSLSIQTGKLYSIDTSIGKELWNKIETLIPKYLQTNQEVEKSQLTLEEDAPRYGKSIFKNVRLGQGAFRMLVTEAYTRKCAISGERTLPVLEAAHIKSYSKSGPHFISNALLLRADIHKLFDTGYITITADLKVEVSKKIKEEFENGREYYKFHGNGLINLPNKEMNKPDKRFIEWHNNIFLG
jgi:putative restriction endonuclease